MALQYDPLDPFGLKARQPQITPLQPVEEQSILSKIGGKALGGLGWVGDFLDKYTGGRAVRGLLGGKPQELASILPFSDQLGLSDEKNRVTGRDLTDQWGLSSAGSDSGWDTAKGIGADVLTNPFTYLMPFGLTKAGESASKIGILPSSTRARIAGLKLPNWTPEVAQKAADVGIPAAEVLNQPLGGLARFHIPFTDISANLGTGAGGTAVLDTLNAVGYLPGISGALGFAGRVTAPVGRHLNALFNAKVKGATSEAGQVAGRGYTAGIEQGMNDIRAWKGQQIDTLGNAGVLDQGPALRATMENPYPSSPIGVQGQAYHDVTGATSDIHNSLDQAGAAKGFAPHQLQDTEAAYASRHMLEPDIGTRGYGGRRQALPINQTALEPREEFLKNIPGGTETINRLSVDPEFSGLAGRFGPGQAPTTPLQRAEMIRGKYLGVSPAEEAQMGGALQKTKTWEGMTPADRQLNPHLQPTADEIALASKHEQSQTLENWAAVNMDPKRLPSAANPQGIPFFGNHPLMDAEKTLVAKLQRNQAGEAVHNLLADTAVDAANAGPGYVPINKALTDVGFDDIGAAQNYLMGKIGGKYGQTPVTQLYVPPDALKDANRFLNGFTTPEALKPILGAVDYITNLTKAFTSGLWPATAGKYVSQALWTNAVHGFTDPAHALLSPLAHAMPYVNAQKLLRAGTIEGAAEIPFLKNMAAARGVAMTDAEATQEIAKLSHQYGATGAGGRGIGDVTGGAQAETLRSVIPGLDPIEGILGPRASEFFPHSLTEANPLNVAGAGSRKDLFSPVNYWRESARTVDETGRLSGFISRLQQGFHPQDAAQQVRAAYLDYGALSDFEKNVMKRFIPFYCVPDDCEILSRRGWINVDDLAVGEDVLALDHQTGKSEWVPCEAKNIFAYDGVLMTMRDRWMDYAFTPDHNWPIFHASPYGERREMSVGWKLKHGFHIPRTSEYQSATSIATPREAAVVGWIVTDGYQRIREWSPNHTEYLIYQSPGKYLAELKELLGDDCTVGKPHPQTGVVPLRIVGEFRRRIQELIPEKKAILTFVCQLDKKSAQACLDAMMKAEGSIAGDVRHLKGRLNQFVQRDGEVIDAFLILAQMCGIAAHKSQMAANGMYSATLSYERPRKKVNPDEISTVWYTGRVWCPTTKHGTWMMRRGGRVIWTGNSYSRAIIPKVLTEIAENPGGLTGQAAMASGALRADKNQFVPEYLGAGAAVPLGKEDNGTQRFLGHLGLPVEAAFEVLKPSLSQSMLGVLGQANPLIKAPLEYATGKQFMSGRDLADLYPLTGNTLIDQGVMNSPLSRTYTVGRTLADERKGIGAKALNLLTGARITDVDMDKQRSILERETLADALRGQQGVGRYETFYPRPDEISKLTPEQIMMLRLQKTLDERAKQKGKEQRVGVGG